MSLNKMSLSSKGIVLPSWHSQVRHSWGVDLQQGCFGKVEKNPFEIYLLGLHHDSVITLGRRAQRGDEVSWTSERLQAEEIEVAVTDRGGLATLHSPGQLVIYPILRLETFGFSIKTYVELLLRTTQKFLSAFGISSLTNDEQPGLFTEFGKIVFIGIRVKEGISTHGISINVLNDLALFDAIKSCGVSRPPLDSMLRYLPEASFGVISKEELLKNLFEEWVRHFLNEMPATDQNN